MILFPYHLPTQRLLLTLLLPPLWGAVAVMALTLLTEPQAFVDGEISAQTAFFLLYVNAAGFWLLPGILAWLMFEAVWNRRLGWTKRWRIYTGFGTLLGLSLGLIAGLLIGLSAGSWSAGIFIAPPLIGAFAGFLTSWICLRISHRRLE